MAGTDGAQGHLEIEWKPQNKRPLHLGPFHVLLKEFGPRRREREIVQSLSKNTAQAHCMNYGPEALLEDHFPYQSYELGQTAAVFRMIDFVLFIVFSVLMSVKFTTRRGQAHSGLVNDVQ